MLAVGLPGDGEVREMEGDEDNTRVRIGDGVSLLSLLLFTSDCTRDRVGVVVIVVAVDVELSLFVTLGTVCDRANARRVLEITEGVARGFRVLAVLGAGDVALRGIPSFAAFEEREGMEECRRWSPDICASKTHLLNALSPALLATTCYVILFHAAFTAVSSRTDQQTIIVFKRYTTQTDT